MENILTQYSKVGRSCFSFTIQNTNFDKMLISSFQLQFQDFSSTIHFLDFSFFFRLVAHPVNNRFRNFIRISRFKSKLPDFPGRNF